MRQAGGGNAYPQGFAPTDPTQPALSKTRVDRVDLQMATRGGRNGCGGVRSTNVFEEDDRFLFRAC